MHLTPKNITSPVRGLIFDLKFHKRQYGSIAFHLAVTEKGFKFNRSPNLGLYVIRTGREGAGYFISSELVRKLFFNRRNDTLSTMFTVPVKTLDNPSFSFMLTQIAEQIMDGKVVGKPSADFYYANLKDFTDAPSR